MATPFVLRAVDFKCQSAQKLFCRQNVARRDRLAIGERHSDEAAGVIVGEMAELIFRVEAMDQCLGVVLADRDRLTARRIQFEVLVTV
jgi:hypothetical protein